MTTATAPHPHGYPVHLEAATEPVASRWLWLVKWLLAFPHYVVLAFLWIAFLVLSVVAFVAILATGRYPRAIFDFNVGVIRWSWRVAYYAYGALATDRYPPFTLEEVDDYPTHLQIDYPEHLSRGLALVKWWLLAIPHYLVVGLLVGGGAWVAWDEDARRWSSGGGLVSLLVIIAAVILAFTGRYPRPLYDLLLGLNRWVLRVAAYVGLMTDQYPPFRLDMGPHEPDAALAVVQSAPAPEAGPPVPQAGAPGPSAGAPVQPASPAQPYAPQQSPYAPQPGPYPPHPGHYAPQPPAGGGGVTGPPARRSGWTGGRILAVVLGAVLGLMGLAGLTGGAAMLVADRGIRDGGFVTTPAQEVDSPGYAVVMGDARIDAVGTDANVPQQVIGDVLVRVTPVRSEPPLFVGLARAADVDDYLGSVARTEARSANSRDDLGGGAPAAPPGDLDIWVAQSSGPGVQELVWAPQEGAWSVVVMNADGSGGVAADVQFGAELPWLWAAGVVVLVFGVLFLAIGVVLVAVGVARASRRAG
jgi:hypothetical protein